MINLDFKETKHYLKRVKYLDGLINSKAEQLKDLRNMVYNISGNENNERVQTSKRVDKIGDIMSKIVDLENELDNDIDKLVDLKAEVTKRIDEIPDMECRLLLMLRYLNFKTWEEIAEKMGYSDRWVRQELHSRALKSFKNLCNTSV